MLQDWEDGPVNGTANSGGAVSVDVGSAGGAQEGAPAVSGWSAAWSAGV